MKCARCSHDSKFSERTNKRCPKCKGEFAFEKVAPGSYLVSGEVTTPALVGVAKVEVPEGKELVDNVMVKLLAK